MIESSFKTNSKGNNYDTKKILWEDTCLFLFKIHNSLQI